MFLFKGGEWGGSSGDFFKFISFLREQDMHMNRQGDGQRDIMTYTLNQTRGPLSKNNLKNQRQSEFRPYSVFYCLFVVSFNIIWLFQKGC